MIGLALQLLLLVSPQDASPRSRVTLENGATVVVESMPSAKFVSAQLFLSFRGMPESRAAHGWRHLAEHLIVKGSDGKLDGRIEAHGMFLQADTFRDAMRIRVEGPPARISEAFAALRDVLSATSFQDLAIRREASIIAEEAALRSDARALSAAAWEHAFGDSGADPLGSEPGLKNANAAALQLLVKELFVGTRAVLAVAGPVEPSDAISAASQVVAHLPKGERSPIARRNDAKLGVVEAEGCLGEARAAVVRSASDPEAAWALAAALAIASEVDGAFVTYTPSLEPGLLIVGQEGAKGFGAKADDVIRRADNRLFAAGKALARRWVLRYLDDPSGSAFLRGYLLAQSTSARPEDLLDNVGAMTESEFRKGMAMFGDSVAIGIFGRGR